MSGKWDKSKVKTLLSRRYYADGALHQVGYTIEDVFPKLITMDQFKAAQDRLEQNRKFYGDGKARNFYMLSGLLVCDHCGGKLSGFMMDVGRKSWRNKKKVYRCMRHYNRKNGLSDADCPCAHINGEMIESEIWEAVVKILTNPQIIFEKLREYEINNGAEEVEVRSQIQRHEEKLTELEGKINRLFSLFEEGHEHISSDVLNDRIGKIKIEQDEIRGKIEVLNNRNQQVIDEQKWMKRFEQSKKKIEKKLGEVTQAEKREIIRTMITRIHIQYEATEAFIWQAEGVFNPVNTGFYAGTFIRSDRIRTYGLCVPNAAL